MPRPNPKQIENFCEKFTQFYISPFIICCFEKKLTFFQYLYQTLIFYLIEVTFGFFLPKE